jgi:hypothetical protein
MWIGTKSRHVQLKTQRFSLDHKSRKLNCPLLFIFQHGQTPRPPLQGATGAADTHLRPWCVAARGKWGGSVAGAPGSFRSTVRWNERPWGTGDGRHGWLVVAALAGPTRRGQATCAAVLAQPRARLRAPPFTSSASPRARVRRRAAATARTDATELWAPGALRLPLSGSTTHAQSQR